MTVMGFHMFAYKMLSFLAMRNQFTNRIAQLHPSPPPSFLGSAGPSNNYCDGFFNFLSIFSLKLTAALDIPNQQFNSCTKIDSTFFPTIAVRGQWALTRATMNCTAPKVFIKLQIDNTGLANIDACDS